MAYSIRQQDNDIQYNVVELVINTRAEITDLPTNFTTGSAAICLEDSSVFMLSVSDSTGNKTWKEI